jgi:GNAT superfamily N-acetyltransferase
MQYSASRAPAWSDERSARSAAPVRRCDARFSVEPVRGPSTVRAGSHPTERSRARRVEYQVRAARITDVERMIALWSTTAPAAGASATLDAGDLLRQLVYLPQATTLVAETLRAMAGLAVLALRPSVHVGGYVGVVDLLVVDPRHDQEQVTGVLVEELLRSARNKGCTVVEVALRFAGPALRVWERFGFAAAGPRIECLIRAERAPAGRG